MDGNTIEMRLAKAREEVDYRYDLGYSELSDEVFFKLVLKYDLDIDADVYHYLEKELKNKKFQLDKNWNSSDYFNDYENIADKKKFVTQGLIGHTLYERDFNSARYKILNIFKKATKENKTESKQEVLSIIESEILPQLFSEYPQKHAEDLNLAHHPKSLFLDTCRNIYYDSYDEFEKQLVGDMYLLYKLEQEKSKIDRHQRTRQPIILHENTPAQEERESASAERQF